MSTNRFSGLGARLAGRLRVTITLNPPDKRRRDIDNFAKAIFDALTHAQVWLDDSQVDDLRIIRGPVMRYGEAIVEIEEDPAKAPLDRDIGSGYV